MWRHLTRGVRSLLNGGAADRHVDEEVQHFIDEAAAAYEADGMPAADAQRAARRRVGNTLAVREEVRASGWEHVVETIAADVRYGMRRLAGHPGFTFVTIATLGLGIGSVTAMLSVAGPVLVQTLPFPNERSHSRRLGSVPGRRARRDWPSASSSRCRSEAAAWNRWRCRACGSPR